MSAAESGLPQRRPRRKPGENRELLIEAGIQEFGLFGYHGASTGAIARIAGVPQPHVYASFHTKQDLFLACCERAITMLLRDHASAHGSDGREDGPIASGLENHHRLLYQMVAALSRPEFRPQLLKLIADLQERIGEEALLGYLSSGALSLLRYPRDVV